MCREVALYYFQDQTVATSIVDALLGMAFFLSGIDFVRAGVVWMRWAVVWCTDIRRMAGAGGPVS